MHEYLETFGERYLYRLDFRARKAIANYLEAKGDKIKEEEILFVYAFEGLKSGANYEKAKFDYKISDMEGFLDWPASDWLTAKLAENSKTVADNVKKLNGKATEKVG